MLKQKLFCPKNAKTLDFIRESAKIKATPEIFTTLEFAFKSRKG